MKKFLLTVFMLSAGCSMDAGLSYSSSSDMESGEEVMDFDEQVEASMKEAFSKALYDGDEAAVKYLLAEGAPVTEDELKGDEYWGLKPLHVAAAMAHPRIVKKLLECKADVNADDTLVAATPLQRIVERTDYQDSAEQIEVVRILLEAGADVTYGGYYNQEGFQQTLLICSHSSYPNKKVADMVIKAHDMSPILIPSLVSNLRLFISSGGEREHA